MIYEKYKKIESSWLKPVPSHWEIRRIASVFEQRKERNKPIKTEEILSLSAKYGVSLYSERKEKGGNKSVLSGVPASLPSLIKAYRIQDKARNVGFDWEKKEQVWDKVKEEFDELQTEISSMDKDKMEAELGDLLFSIINAARLYGINPDNALERTNHKFIRRFTYLEENTIKQGHNLKDMSLEEMDKYWNEAKKKGL